MADQNLAASAGGNVDLLNQLRTYLAAAKLRLYQSSFTPVPSNVQADYVAAEATFTGYPAGGLTVTWSAVGTDPTFVATMVGSRSFFQATDAASPNLIGGLWIESAGGVVEFYCNFAVPIPMDTALRWLAATPFVTLPGVGVVDVES